MKKQVNLFKRLKDYLNSFDEYSEVTRQELLTDLYGPDVNFCKEHTIDDYRRSLCLGGYMEQTSSPGLYIANIKQIPDDLTLAELNRRVYSLRAR